MIIKLRSKTAKLLGDPHRGRRFVNGVPIHRLGDREAMVKAQFDKHLMECDGVDYHIMMGDIFDKATVPPTVVLDVFQSYVRAVQANPQTGYILIRGNHDGSRDLEKKSSFDLLAAMLAYVENVWVPTGPTVINDLFAVVPWDPVIPAKELVADLPKVEAVFGHWDIESYGGEDHNLIPLPELKGKTARVYTGHYHHPKTFTENGIEVVVTGSMQPYNHSEDPNDDLYVTLTVKEVEEVLETAPDYFHGRCLRVLLDAGEKFEHTIDCLQLTFKRKQAEDQEVEVSFDDFDFNKLFTETMEKFGVKPDVSKTLWSQYTEKRTA